MKKKTRQPKDQLIDSLLEDLKDSSKDEGLHIGPDGVEASGVYSEQNKNSSKEKEEVNEKTTLLEDSGRMEVSRPDYGAQFFVSDENKTKPFEAIARQVKSDLKKEQFNKDIPEGAVAFEEIQKPKEATVSLMSESKMQTIERKTPIDVGGIGTPVKKVPEKENRFMKAENAKLAQERILELEQEIEKCRRENEMIASAHELAKSKLEELLGRNMQLERQRNEFKEASESELKIFREGLLTKDTEIQKLKSKIEELEHRLGNDLRKVRVRERELENRLELTKAEKLALVRSKDETILELKRKQDALLSEIEHYQRRVLDLSQKIDLNQEQFARTVRALRLALTNLEVNEETVVPGSGMKKAE